MAVHLRFPALTWQDHQGTWTARLCDRDFPAGIGRTMNQALGQLQEYLEYVSSQGASLSEPDFEDPRLSTFRVEVRPEYAAEGRRFPLDDVLTLPVHVVRASTGQGMRVCSMPLLGMRFYYHEKDELEGLVVHYVQQAMKGKAPGELAQFLPPREVCLEEVGVTVRTRVRKARLQAEPTELTGVADALGDPWFRRQFSRPYAREGEANSLVRRLANEHASLLLVGEPGSGKTTILVEAVRQAEREGGSRFWQTSAGRIIAGMKYLGQWELRCEQLISEVNQRGGVLCIDNLLGLVQAGGRTPGSSLAAFFLPYLQRGELRMVAEATPSEVDACRRLLPGLADVFQAVPVPEMSREQALSALRSLADAQGANWHIGTAHGVPELAYNLFRRFLPYGAFPGAASRFLAEVYETARRDAVAEVDQRRVVSRFVRRTGLPEWLLRDEAPFRRDDAVEAFRRRVHGQEEACQAAADVVTAFKAGLNDPGRPIAVMLFCGPTGVGKTELAKALSAYLFGAGEDTARLVRLDMSEYTGFGAGGRLITRPDGQPGELVRRVREQPFVVLLLDEIEKADAEAFDVLMGVFDEGRLADREGRLTLFRSALIVMTSNLGAGRRSVMGFGQAPAVDYDREAMGFFRPEFFNRIDRVVTFQPLGQETVRSITRKELAELGRREGFTRLGLHLEWSPALEEHLAAVGFDPELGARPLQRAIEQRVVAPLARYLLDNPGLRDDILLLDWKDDRLVVQK